GTIVAQAGGDFSGDASGVVARSSLLSATVYNSGVVFAQAEGLYADAVGAYATAGEGAAVNTTADLEEGDARAYGAFAYGNFTGIYNLGDGAISANAQGAYALAVGAWQDG